jgi:hypothetical protein
MAFAAAAPTAPESNPVPRLVLPIIAFADLPDATKSKGQLLICEDGAAGSPCMVVSDGVGWFQVAVGNAAAAS